MPGKKGNVIRNKGEKKIPKKVKKPRKIRPLILQGVKGFQANLNLIKPTFGRLGVPGCVEVVRLAGPKIQMMVDAAIAKGAKLKGNWRPVFVAKAADELISLKVPKAQVEEFKARAAEALGLKI